MKPAPTLAGSLSVFAFVALLAVASSGDAQVISRPRTGTGASIVVPPSTPPAERLQRLPTAPGPKIYEVKGFGTKAALSWGSVIGAASYFVTRTMPSNPNCCSASSPQLTGMTWLDSTLLWPGDYVYRVHVNYTDGRQGYTDVTYTRPVPQDPTGFVATSMNPGEVTLQWSAVPGIASFMVRGPGTPAGGKPVNGTSVTLSGLPLSRAAQEWSVTSLYGSAGALTDSAAWPRATAEVSAFGSLAPVVWVEGRVVSVDLTFTSVRGATSFRVTQIDPDNQSTEPSFQQLFRLPSGSFDRVGLRLMPQLQPEMPYRYQLFATMGDGSMYTGPIATVTLPIFQVRTTIPISNDRIILEWNTFGSPPYIVKKGLRTQSGATSALVFEEVRDQAGNVVQFTGRRFDDLVVQHGVQYTYQVCATVASGMLCPSTEVTFP